MTDRRSSRATARVTMVLLSVAGLLGLVGGAPPAHAAGVRYVDEVFTSVERTNGIVYGNAHGQNGAENLVLDLYQPQGDVAALRPAVVYIHGGYFAPGSYNRQGPDAVTFGNSMAKRGYVVVSIDYRVYAGPLNDPARLVQGVTSALEDGQAAVRWLRANALNHRIHGDAIAASGYSAGAITALNMGFRADHQGSSGNGGYRQDIQAVISYAGATGSVTPNAPPIQMHGGDLDTLVTYNAQRATCNNAIAAGNLCEFHTYAGADHISMGVVYMLSDLIPKAANFLNTHVIPNLSNKPRSVLASPVPSIANRPANGSAATNFDGRLEYFGSNLGGTMMNVFQHAIGQGWSGFYPFPNGGGSLTTKPISAFHNADGRLEVGLLGTDGRIYTSQQRPGLFGWMPFEPVGRAGLTFASPPTFGLTSGDRLEVFAVTTGGALLHAFQDRQNGDWSDWYPFDNRAYSTDPEGGATVHHQDGLLEVAIVGADGFVYHARQHDVGSGWTSFQPVGSAAATGKPAFTVQLVVQAPNTFWYLRPFVYRGADGVLHQTLNDGVHNVTDSVVLNSPSVQRNPALVANADGRLEVFATGTDGKLWHSFQAAGGGSFQQAYSLGGSCAHPPSALPNDDGRLEVFCVAAAGDLRHDFQRWPNGPWFGSTSLGGTLAA